MTILGDSWNTAPSVHIGVTIFSRFTPIVAVSDQLNGNVSNIKNDVGVMYPGWLHQLTLKY